MYDHRVFTGRRRRPSSGGAGAALVAVMACALAGCPDDRGGGRDDPAPGAAPGASAARDPMESDARADFGPAGDRDGGVGALPAPTPRWHITMPGAAGAIAVDHVAGPVVLAPARGEAPLVLFASSAIGVVAVDASAGAVRWQRREESAPGTPVEAAPDAIWLPGRCARAAPSPAPEPGRRVLGCVERVDRAGRLQARSWVSVAVRDPSAPAPRRSRAVGRLGEHLAWAHGAALLAVAPAGSEAASGASGHAAEVSPTSPATSSRPWRRASGTVGRAAEPGPRAAAALDGSSSESPKTAGAGPHAARIAAHYRPAAAVGDGAGAGLVHGWLERDDALVVATNLGLLGYRGCAGGGPCAPAWSRVTERAAGVAGPVGLGPHLAWVRDQVLAVGPNGRAEWTAPGYYAHVPGSLVQLDEHRLLAWRIDAGVRPVVLAPPVDPAPAARADRAAPERTVAPDLQGEQPSDVRNAVSGAREGDAAPGIQVLATAVWPTGVAAAVRLDTSLRRDAVFLWSRELDLQLAWPLPRPMRPRAEPVAMAAVPSSERGYDLLVFYDGRAAARLPAAAPP